MRRDRRCSRRAGRRRRAQAGTIPGADAADPPRGGAECPGSTDDSEDIFLVPGLVHAELHAAVNLADLEAGERYVITHGSFRPLYDQRRDAFDAAFDRMEAS